MVYAKSWGALPFFGNWEPEKPIRDQFKHFIVDERKMALTNNGVFSHCLPLRRNVKATDARRKRRRAQKSTRRSRQPVKECDRCPEREARPDRPMEKSSLVGKTGGG